MRNRKEYSSLPHNLDLQERAKALRKTGNLCEVLLWQQLHKRKFKGLDFDRQKVIENYIVDFYCGNCNVVVEIDGSSHDTKVAYDATRDTFLESLGLIVVHIPARDILQKLDDVMQMLDAHPSLQP